MTRAATWAAGALLAAGAAGAEPLTLELREVPVIERAVGTVRARTEAQVMAQANGRVLEVTVREGVAVQAGEVLARIDDRELALRLSQARRGVEAAEAQRGQAEQGLRGATAGLTRARSELDRVLGFAAKGAATPQQQEAAEAVFGQAQAAEAQARYGVEAAAAGVHRAREGVAEVEVLRRYTVVEAPIAGVVAARAVEPGDLAWPGRLLLTLHTPDQLVLEAHVREGLVERLGPGAAVTARVGERRLDARVLELVPLADPISRKVTVKVGLPPIEDVVPGMFARLEIPLGSRPALVVPDAAIERRGQLTVATVLTERGPRRRLVRLGARHEGGHEVLAGLRAGEVVEVREAPQVTP